MTRVLAGVQTLARLSHGIAGVSLVSLMLLTVADVVLRAFRMPVPGTFELVGYAGAVAIGFSVPLTSWRRGHVYVDSFLIRLPKSFRPAFHVVTRFAGVALFVLLGWNLIRFGLDLRASGEVSPTLQFRFYPVAFGLAAAAFLEVAVLLCDLVKIFRGEYE